MTDFDHLRQIDRLFEHRYDAFVVATLAQGPRRFGRLSFDVQAHVMSKVPDSTLSRILGRLRRTGIIGTSKVDGHATYSLTKRGEAMAAIIAAITQALDHDDGPGQEDTAAA